MPSREEAVKKPAPKYIPNQGFLLVDGEKGQIYMRLFSYVRYLNQKGLDPTYIDFFGNAKTVKQREDIQLNKFFLPFSGWFLTPEVPLLPLRLVVERRPRAIPRRSWAPAT